MIPRRRWSRSRQQRMSVNPALWFCASSAMGIVELQSLQIELI
jgi:hypothetical protein